jgi:hypothetical protein
MRGSGNGRSDITQNAVHGCGNTVQEQGKGGGDPQAQQGATVQQTMQCNQQATAVAVRQPQGEGQGRQSGALHLGQGSFFFLFFAGLPYAAASLRQQWLASSGSGLGPPCLLSATSLSV